jgi:small subunit ribosomal protein S3
MGQKVNPIGLRVGIIEDWRSKWFSDREYARFIQEDALIRDYIRKALPRAGVSTIEIERKGSGQAEKCKITIHTSRPGVVIGRRGQGIDQLKKGLTPIVSGDFTIDVKEVRIPELDARLVAQMVAEQLEARVSHRRAMKRALTSVMRAGARGVRIQVAGRLGGSEMSRREWYREGRVPLHTLRARIDYGFAEAHTKFGRIGVKVWIYLGDVMEEANEETLPAPAEAEESVAPVTEEVEEVAATEES